jgi:hypothetical protein
MNGMRREQTNLRSIQLNQGVVESALDELLYRPRFSCQWLTPQAGGPVFNNVNSTVCLDYAAGANAGARMTWPVPSPFWVAGTATIKIWWTGDTVSNTPVQWQFAMSPTALGGVPTNLTATIANVVFRFGTINAEQEYQFTSSVNVLNSSHATSGVNITRNGAIDTYPGIARLYAFQLIYTPAAGH